MSQNCRFTYVSVEFGEGVDHIKSMHINYSSVDDQLRPEHLIKDNKNG